MVQRQRMLVVWKQCHPAYHAISSHKEVGVATLGRLHNQQFLECLQNHNKKMKMNIVEPNSGIESLSEQHNHNTLPSTSVSSQSRPLLAARQHTCLAERRTPTLQPAAGCLLLLLHQVDCPVESNRSVSFWFILSVVFCKSAFGSNRLDLNSM